MNDDLSKLRFKVMPCPVDGGKHPCHNQRFIASADAEVEYCSNDTTDWMLSEGWVACQMRDVQPGIGQLFASSPELLEALEDAIPELEATLDSIPDEQPKSSLRYVIAKAKSAIAKATGRETA